MSDEIDNTEWGIDRRTVLKGAAAVSGAGLVGVSATGTVAADGHCGPGCEPQCQAEVPLYAGQNTEVGTVHIRRVPGGDELEIEYDLDGETENDWYLRETHLYVGKTDPTELSSAPGQFPFTKEDYADGVTEDTYTIGFGEVCEYEIGGGGKGKGGGGKWEEVDGSCGVEEEDCVYIAAHAVVDEVLIEAPYFAADADYTASQGVKKNGNEVGSDRSDPADALVKAYPDENFFSLGFMPDDEGGFQDEGGSIEVTFDCPIVNGEGDDIRLWEVTFGDYPAESADVYAGYEGDWRLLGTADNSGQGDEGSPEAHTLSTFDLSNPADGGDAIESTEKLRIVDTTDPGPHNGSADAFDLDGIEVLQDCTEDETAWGDGYDGCEITDRGNWATYFQYGIGSCTYDISGTVYDDADGDGTFDDGEGLGGETVKLEDDAGNVVATTTTDSDGSYTFEDILGGEDYTVVVEAPDGYVGTENSGGYEITNLDGDLTGVDFGFTEEADTFTYNVETDFEGGDKTDTDGSGTIKFESTSEPALGEDGRSETDTFTFTADCKDSELTVETKNQDTVSETITPGETVTMSNGFDVTWNSITDNGDGTYTYEFTVTSDADNTTGALSYVAFDTDCEEGTISA